MLPDNLEADIRDVVNQWSATSKIAEIAPLTPDASSRYYYRISFAGNAPHQRVLAVYYDGVRSPEATGHNDTPADKAYVSLTAHLKAHGVRVPELIFDASLRGIFLLEDLGETLLFNFLSDSDVSEERKWNALRCSIDFIFCYQGIPIDENYFAVKRQFSHQTYVKEMEEFGDFYLPHVGADSSTFDLAKFYHIVADELCDFELCLVHRDFHAWNLLVLDNDDVAVIDFQDSLLGTRYYDIVSLLFDRDIEEVMGDALHARALEYFKQRSGFSDEFSQELARVSLQRDLKVVGRFAKLSSKMNKKTYEKWIPGTASRLLKNAQHIATGEDSNPMYREFVDVFKPALGG